MQVTFNLGEQPLWSGRWNSKPVRPGNSFYYDKKRARQKYKEMRVESGLLRVAAVYFEADEMDPEFRIRTMDAIVGMCEIKWAELYGN